MDVSAATRARHQTKPYSFSTGASGMVPTRITHNRTNLGRAIGHDRSLFTDAHYRLAGGKMFN